MTTPEQLQARIADLEAEVEQLELHAKMLTRIPQDAFFEGVACRVKRGVSTAWAKSNAKSALDREIAAQQEKG